MRWARVSNVEVASLVTSQARFGSGNARTNSPEATDSATFRLFSERPKDWREEEEEVLLADSDAGRAGFATCPVSAFSRSFSAFRISISFCGESGNMKTRR